MRRPTEAFALVLGVLILLKVAASLVTVSITPLATLFGLVLIGTWFLDKHGPRQ